jgi:RHS repeat-associated protein
MTGTGGGITGGWERGRVQFELSNHLGNVLVTISDARTAVDDGTYEVLTACPTCLPGFACLPCYDVYIKQNSTPDGVVDYYLPQVLTANDYYPFGMGMPGRKYSEGEYRYGFNGKENDNDVKGAGNQQDYGMRIYDPRLGKFLSVDPLTEEYPWYTPYQFAGNKPIEAVDLDGEEEAYANLLPSYRAADRNSLIVAGVKRQKAESEWLSRLNDYEVVQWNPYRQRAEIGRRTNVEKRIRADRNEYSVALGENIRGGVFGSGLYLLAGDKGAFAGGPLDQIMTTKVALTNPSAPSIRSKPVTRQPAVASKVINNNVIANGAQNQVEPISNPVNFKYLKGFGRENPYTYLGEALIKQHLNRIPAALKESWSSNGFDYEVRIHPADSKYGLSGSIFRVARRLQGTSGNNQGFGFEYLDINGNWFPQSVLKPGKAGNSNPTYNEQAAKDTHIKLNANN